MQFFTVSDESIYFAKYIIRLNMQLYWGKAVHWLRDLLSPIVSRPFAWGIMHGIPSVFWHSMSPSIPLRKPSTIWSMTLIRPFPSSLHVDAGLFKAIFSCSLEFTHNTIFFLQNIMSILVYLSWKYGAVCGFTEIPITPGCKPVIILDTVLSVVK